MEKTYIIAEIAQGFEGDVNLVKRFIKLAKKCGADGVKFQIFMADELCINDYQYYNFFKSLEISPEVWTAIIDEAVQMGIDVWTDIYGFETLQWISKTKIKGYKIHSTDSKNFKILTGLKDKGYTILLSTGGSSMSEVEKAVHALGNNNLVLMSGFQAEPNLYSDVELDKLVMLKEKFAKPVGYADHLDANDDLAITLPAMAVLKGATYIEKHLTIDRNHVQLEDYVSALNPDEFKKMVETIRKVEQFNRINTYKLSEREEAYRMKTKKVVLAANDIPAGKKIEPSDLTMLRTGQQYDEIIDLEEIIGRNASTNIKKISCDQKTNAFLTE